MRTVLAMSLVCAFGCRSAPATSAPRAAPPQAAAISAAERAGIDARIREHLGLPAGAPLGGAEFARVTALDLSRAAISDAGVAWLADRQSPLT